LLLPVEAPVAAVSQAILQEAAVAQAAMLLVTLMSV
jgi:hypothetical protein